MCAEPIRTFLQRHRPAWQAVWVLLLGVVSWFAFKPATEAAALQHLDKLQHLGAFISLTLVAAMGWPAHRAWTGRIAWGLLGYGLFIELVQTQLPTRSGELADWLTDALGIALGLWLAQRMRV